VDADARIEALEAEVERLQARIEQLEEAAGIRFVTPLEWRLTPAEMRVFGVLMARELATKDAIMAALYRDTGRDEAEIKIVDVLVCKIRAKLRAFDVSIQTVWGQGYRLTPPTKAKVREMIGLGAVA
jgi:two-component system cell cycle response regulator CtrA